MKYEKPKLTVLGSTGNDTDIAAGYCADGSGAGGSGECMSGFSATDYCENGNTNAGADCQSGTGASSWCGSGVGG